MLVSMISKNGLYTFVLCFFLAFPSLAQTQIDLNSQDKGKLTITPGNSDTNGAPCVGSPQVGASLMNCDWHFLGPNPWIDITRFGARPLVLADTPSAVGITAKTTSGSGKITISSPTCTASTQC